MYSFVSLTACHYSGAIEDTPITISPAPILSGFNVSDFGSCPLIVDSLLISRDTIVNCSVDTPVTIIPSGGASYTCTIIDGSGTISGTGPDFTINTLSMVTVAMTSQGNSKCFPIAYDTVTAIPVDYHIILTPDNMDPCDGQTVTLNVSPDEAGVTYQWFNNTATIAGVSISEHTINDAGQHYVIASPKGCQDTTNIVMVNKLPVPEAAVRVINQPVCIGDTVVLTANTAAGHTYF